MPIQAEFKSTYRGVAEYLITGDGEPYRVRHFFMSAERYADDYGPHWNYTRESYKRERTDRAGGYYVFGGDVAKPEAIAAIKDLNEIEGHNNSRIRGTT